MKWNRWAIQNIYIWSEFSTLTSSALCSFYLSYIKGLSEDLPGELYPANETGLITDYPPIIPPWPCIIYIWWFGRTSGPRCAAVWIRLSFILCGTKLAPNSNLVHPWRPQPMRDYVKMQHCSLPACPELPTESPPKGISFTCLCLLFLTAWGNQEALTCGNLTGIHWPAWMHSAGCYQPPLLSPPLYCPHCHQKSDTHERKAFNWVYSWVLSSPTAQCWRLNELLFGFPEPPHGHSPSDIITVNIWAFGRGDVVCCSSWLSERSQGNSLDGNVCVVLAEAYFHRVSCGNGM